MLVLGRATGRVPCCAAAETERSTSEGLSIVMLTGATFAHFSANGQSAGEVSLPEGIWGGPLKVRNPKSEGRRKSEDRNPKNPFFSDFVPPCGISDFGSRISAFKRAGSS